MAGRADPRPQPRRRPLFGHRLAFGRSRS